VVLLPVWIFTLVVAVLSPIASSDPTVSWFKLFSFALGATAVLATTLALSTESAQRLGGWLPSVVVSIVLVSIPTLPFAGISYRVAPTCSKVSAITPRPLRSLWRHWQRYLRRVGCTRGANSAGSKRCCSFLSPAYWLPQTRGRL